MPTRNHSRFPRIGNSLRRKTGWEDGPSGTTAAIVASGKTLFAIGQTALIDGLTVVRTRGQCSFFVDQSPTAAIHMRYAFGIAKVSGAAFAVGVTAIPGPLADSEWDGWLFHKWGVAGLEAGNVGGISAAFEIDSKAMRKFAASDVMVGMIEVEETGAVSLVVDLDTRMLVKLP